MASWQANTPAAAAARLRRAGALCCAILSFCTCHTLRVTEPYAQSPYSLGITCCTTTQRSS